MSHGHGHREGERVQNERGREPGKFSPPCWGYALGADIFMQRPTEWGLRVSGRLGCSTWTPPLDRGHMNLPERCDKEDTPRPRLAGGLSLRIATPPTPSTVVFHPVHLTAHVKPTTKSLQHPPPQIDTGCSPNCIQTLNDYVVTVYYSPFSKLSYWLAYTLCMAINLVFIIMQFTFKT